MRMVSKVLLYDLISILHSLFYADILLILGTPGAIILPLLKLFNKKIIVNFGGLEWKRESGLNWLGIILNLQKNLR